MYLLDTNHCSKLIDGNPEIVKRLTELGDAPVSICSIVCGELMFMAFKSERKDENLAQIRAFLDDIDIYPVDEKAAHVYGELKAAIISHFGPRNREKRRSAKIEDLGFTDNDLWIAAVAKSQDLTIVSMDGDFIRLKEVDDLSVESWLTSAIN